MVASPAPEADIMWTIGGLIHFVPGQKSAVQLLLASKILVSLLGRSALANT